MKMGEVEYPSLQGKVADPEWRTRVDLAALLRLIPHMGWWDLTQAPAAARIPGEPHYLFPPQGCLFEELTASSLIKITLDGDQVSDTPLSILRCNWVPFKAVFSVRQDVDWAIHSHDDWVTALSARKERLQPISQSAAIALADGVAYHEYDGVETLEQRIPALQQSLGSQKRLILQNHGLVAVGKSPYEVLLRTAGLTKACRVQVLAGRSDELVHVLPEVLETLARDAYRPGAIEYLWPALLRKLDRLDPSYKE
jgi:ribulose-5-phosphate 4-epimerase/fuculose-1-phosphate aldolase